MYVNTSVPSSSWDQILSNRNNKWRSKENFNMGKYQQIIGPRRVHWSQNWSNNNSRPMSCKLLRKRIKKIYCSVAENKQIITSIQINQANFRLGIEKVRSFLVRSSIQNIITIIIRLR